VERRSGKYFGAGTALRQISLATGGTLTLKRFGIAYHVVLVRLSLDKFILWPKLPPNAGFGIRNLKKISAVTPSDPPPSARLHAVRGTQDPPLLGPRSRKPFLQIKIYQYTPGYDTGSYFKVRSKAGISQLNLPHGTKTMDNKSGKEKKNTK